MTIPVDQWLRSMLARWWFQTGRERAFGRFPSAKAARDAKLDETILWPTIAQAGDRLLRFERERLRVMFDQVCTVARRNPEVFEGMSHVELLKRLSQLATDPDAVWYGREGQMTEAEILQELTERGFFS